MVTEPGPLCRIVAISDYCTRVPPLPGGCWGHDAPPVRSDENPPVRGGYLERLPLAAIRAGLANCAEIWSFVGDDATPGGLSDTQSGIGHRRFRANAHPAPYGSAEMSAHIARHGAPDILCIWGLGVTEETLQDCPDAIKIYNSLDVDAIRIAPDISRHIDIFLTGSDEQSAEVLRRHPGALVEMLPIGPEFASPETFFPTGAPKDIDVIYVAAAQDYKRHDILFDALAGLPRHLRCLCVFGYGELADDLRHRAASMGLNVECVGPPGVPHDEVNRLMNRARVGVVCGVDDGAPAILTEYMLAGLPVLANAELRCGLHYITPETGRTATATGFADMLAAMLHAPEAFSPREAVMRHWTWPHSIDRLANLITAARQRRAGGHP
jgi:glycosyltransferase involved in cell wall biosynthesis